MSNLSNLSFAPKLTATKLTAGKILERMPYSSADELQGIHTQLQTTYQSLLRIGDGQLLRLLAMLEGDHTRASWDKTVALLRRVMPELSDAIAARRVQEAEQSQAQQAIVGALYKTFGALAQTRPGQSKPDYDALLQVMRWMLIAESDLYFSWFLTPAGNLAFFEEEQPRLVEHLTLFVLETAEHNTDCPFNQAINVAIKQLHEVLSRPLDKIESAVFKSIKEELTVELSENVVLLNVPGKHTAEQGEC